jgi:hypothetical protein
MTRSESMATSSNWEPTGTSWEPTEEPWTPAALVQCISVEPWLLIPGSDEPCGCHDLTLGRIYEMLKVEAGGAFLRIYDDSGEDFLYPASHFRTV